MIHDALSDKALVDDIAKEMYIRRVFSAKDMRDYELEVCAKDCLKKATIFVKTRGNYSY